MRKDFWYALVIEEQDTGILKIWGDIEPRAEYLRARKRLAVERGGLASRAEIIEVSDRDSYSHGDVLISLDGLKIIDLLRL